MTRHYPDLGSASDWLNQISHAARPIRNATQIRVVTRHQYGISALVSHTSISGEPVVASPNVGCLLRLVAGRRSKDQGALTVLHKKFLATTGPEVDSDQVLVHEG